MPRGRLRVYLGVAPGAGATHALLEEGVRRRARGVDVVVGVVDLRGRAPLVDVAASLEAVGDGTFLDTEGILRRRPTVVLVDNLAEPAHPHERGSSPRWAEVERLLAAGIEVVATVEVRAVESLAEPIERVVGDRPRRSVPDRFLRDADQVQLVDIPPQALRRRLAHGRLYGPEDIDAAVSAGFRPRTLSALRELALRWVGSTVPRQHDAWARSLGEDDPLRSVHERLLVALSGGPATTALLHRAARLAGGSSNAELLAVHVLAEPTAETPAADVRALRERAEAVGARFQQVVGDSVARTLLDVAHVEGATQVVVGAPRRRPRLRWVAWAPHDRRPDVGAELAALADEGIDVHIVATGRGPTPGARMPAARRALSRQRLLSGFGLAVALPATLTAVLLKADSQVGLPGDSLILLLGVVVTSLVGGLWPAVVGAVVGSTMLNFFFIPPVRTFRVGEPPNVITLVVFVVVAILVSAVVQRAAATAAQAARASAESRTLSAVATSALHGDEALPALLDQLCAAFGMTSAALLARSGAEGEGWRTVTARGANPPGSPAVADVQVSAGEDLVLALRGQALAAGDRRVLQAFAARAQGLIERDSLARSAAVAERLEATEHLRDALLAAVGHDLRTPLASATAAVSSLRSQDVTWTPADRDELLDTAEQSLARLGRLVADLLDLSRLRAGALTVQREPVWLDEVIPPALDELGEPGRAVELRIGSDLPAAQADPALLTRVMVNVVGNALRYAPTEHPPIVTASSGADLVEVRIVDRGPGLPPEDVERVFVPFQRLGDTDNRAGLGLGLALSRGLVEAMGGTLRPEETPGGGLTMVISLEASGSDDSADRAEPGRRERQEGS